MGGRGANKEEAERAVTRGIGFTSELPPPGSTSYPREMPFGHWLD